MTRPIFRLSLLAGVSASLALAAASLAQPAPPTPGPPMADAAHHHMDPAQIRAHMADFLRAVLQLQPSQDGALDAFLDAVASPGGVPEQMRHQGEADEHLTTPERLDRMLGRLDEARARLAKIAAATKQFYAALTPAQQRALDALHAGGMHGDMGMMGGVMGGDDKHIMILRHGDHDGEGPREMGPDGPPRG